ncbi:hypothetical protein ACWD3D_35670, partial [Streptomyces sp. NPDC002690]
PDVGPARIPGGARTPQRGATRSNPAVVPLANRPHAAPPAEGETIDGLPCRVPQASLAGELADDSGAGTRTPLMGWGGNGQEQHGYVGGIGWDGSGQPYAETYQQAGDAQSPSQAHVPQSPYPQEPSAFRGAAAGWTAPDAPAAAHGQNVFPYATASRQPGVQPYPDRPVRGRPRIPALSPEELAERPERVRSMMSALQAGAARARVGQYSGPGDGDDGRPGPVHPSQTSHASPERHG